MAKSDELYIANLAFLLDYGDGTSNDEIEYELYKVAFQDKGTVHYDRSIGGNFRDLEQDIGNVSTMMWFTTNMIESIYNLNQEKNNNPYIIVGYNDIVISEESVSDGRYLVELSYRLLKDITTQGTVTI